MHIYQLDKWKHDHSFVDLEASQANERRTLYVVLLTFVMMIVEIAAGMMFNSMALLADGWHMASHAGALGLSVFAYRFARKHANDASFTFGVGKVEILGGYTSAVILGVVALLMAWESIDRLFNPQSIAFNEAMMIAAIGLVVNLVSAFMLHGDGHHHHHHGHSHGHHHDHSHAHDHHHHAHGNDHQGTDHNLRAAYLHVLADAFTSVLAIVALLMGKFYGWNWMDALMGIVGALVISKWAYGLLIDTGTILLDRVEAPHLSEDLKSRIETDADNRIVDMHIWHVGNGKYSAILSLVTHHPRGAEHYRALVKDVNGLAHVTVEVNVCEDEACLPVSG
ncbi:CDF family Co(II)/Ni(II) efflux transporter DmeF [Cohaesibacter celericrescens]|uniref:CDF family Co(II)/Ni(II) efflux transporter DmeF n=1 Tax=Cohaesibacter celericrescens TaxID=2067669 RepID=UPI003564CA15